MRFGRRRKKSKHHELHTPIPNPLKGEKSPKLVQCHLSKITHELWGVSKAHDSWAMFILKFKYQKELKKLICMPTEPFHFHALNEISLIQVQDGFYVRKKPPTKSLLLIGQKPKYYKVLNIQVIQHANTRRKWSCMRRMPYFWWIVWYVKSNSHTLVLIHHVGYQMCQRSSGMIGEWTLMKYEHSFYIRPHLLDSTHNPKATKLLKSLGFNENLLFANVHKMKVSCDVLSSHEVIVCLVHTSNNKFFPFH